MIFYNSAYVPFNEFVRICKKNKWYPSLALLREKEQEICILKHRYSHPFLHTILHKKKQTKVLEFIQDEK